MNWFWRDIWDLPLGVWLAALLVLLSGAVVVRDVATRPAREAAQCHHWYSAASTARDSLWITTLRKECTP